MADPEVLSRLDKMIELLQNQQTRPVRATRTNRPERVKKPISSSVGSLGNDFPSISQAQPAPIPSKVELVKQWFKDHPEDLHHTGRYLEEQVKPQGVKISYKTWNQVKSDLAKEG